MKSGICFENILLDDNLIELSIIVDDGKSKFSNKVYTVFSDIEQLVKDLKNFSKAIYGGVTDIQLGGFGPEYASGAFSGRFHFYKPGKLFISIRMQTNFFDFGMKNVASEATLYLISEPSLLDTFIRQLSVIHKSISNNAVLECVTDELYKL